MSQDKHYRALLTDDFHQCPLHRIDFVEQDDSALSVFSDFAHHRPHVIRAGASIDDALRKMKASGDHLLLVIRDSVDEKSKGRSAGTVVGQITACDIVGDRPIKLAHDNDVHRDEVTVGMAMTPREDIRVLDWEIVRRVKVGQILATMREMACCHILVFENGELRGSFEQSEINKRLDHMEIEPLHCARSLAELSHLVG
jgi:signal-transduction protein with cAMP-binding, CBS, and nucleotidyltransferase domain